MVVSRRGTTAGDAARQVGGADTATDWRAAVERDDVDLVLVGTRHDSHAEIAASALRAGKAVLVEKPLGLTREEIDSVWEAGRGNDRLAIGFNRPFAPLARALHDEVRAAGEGPLQLIYRVSSPLPAEHWLNDPVSGGGRVLGEACHMFDFANWLCGSPVRVYAAALPAPATLRTWRRRAPPSTTASGSIATVHYSGVGAASMPKERIEVLHAGRSWVLDDFRSLTSYDGSGASTQGGRSVDKGHAELMGACSPRSAGAGPSSRGSARPMPPRAWPSARWSRSPAARRSMSPRRRVASADDRPGALPVGISQGGG